VSEAREEKFSSKVSAVADMSKLASEYLKFSPGLGMIASYASLALDGVAGVARIFGHSRPIEEDKYVSSYTSPPLATGNSNLNGRILALDRDHAVSMSGQITGRVDVDELTFKYLLEKPVIIGTYEWKSTQPCGTVLFDLVNTCCPGVYGWNAQEVAMPSQSLVTANFGLAHWVNHYRITIITPRNNAGALQIVSEPTGKVTNFSTITNRSIIMDISETKTIDIDVHWQQPQSLRTVHPGYMLDPFGDYVPECMNGALQVIVENPLSPFTDST